MTKNWYLNQLYKNTNQPTLTFAFRGTINWMRALAIVCEEDINNKSIQKFYNEVNRRKDNNISDLKVFENILMSIHNLHTIVEINKNIENPYSIARTQIVNWYYSIYYASSAMCAAQSGSTHENHTGTSKIFQNNLVKNKLIMDPFNLSVDTLIEKEYKNQIKKLRNGNKIDLNTYPTNYVESKGCLYSYLTGTSDYRKWQLEENFKGSIFKQLKVENFRTKQSQILRDEKLEKGFTNFLTQAFRYRGKAHYRDSVFLSYGADNSEQLKQFLKDLEIVAISFIKMSSYYSKKRVKEENWNNFITDLKENLLFEFDMDMLEIDTCVE